MTTHDLGDTMLLLSSIFVGVLIACLIYDDVAKSSWPATVGTIGMIFGILTGLGALLLFLTPDQPIF